MNRIRLIGLMGLLLGICYFGCEKTLGPITNNNTGGSEVVGTLVLKTGGPAKNAQVKAYKVLLGSTGSDSTVSTDSVLADTGGHYQFDNLSVGNYNFQCKAFASQDTFYGSIQSFHLDSVAPPKQPTIVYNIGIDTLYPPGSISGRVALNYGSTAAMSGVLCAIPGTSYMATTDTGYFIMTNVPAGTYAVRFSDNNFADTQIQNIVVKSGDTTNIGTIKMYLSGSGIPPAPLELKSAFDTSSGIVTLGWDSVPIPDFKKFLIIRKDSNSVNGLFRTDSIYTAVASLIDTILFTDTLGYSVSYSVQCFDNSGHFSDPSQSITINAKPPTGQTTDNLKAPDSAGVFDKISVIANFTNSSSQVKTVTWSTSNGDSVHTINKNFGADTLKISFAYPGRQTIFFRTIDNLGRTSKDSTFVTIVKDLPKINFITKNQTVVFGSTVQCSLAVTHSFGVCTLTVDFGNNSSVAKSWYKSQSIVFDTVFKTSNMGNTEKVDIKITDSHGNFIDTGFTLTILQPIHDQWVKLTPMNNHHFAHSSAVINSALYVVGGESMSPITGKPISSSAVEAFDTANSWVNRNSLLDAQDNLLTCVYNNKIYTFAGNNQKTGYVSFGEQFDPQSIQSAWTKFDSMYVGTTPFSRKYCATCLWQNNLYLFGGVRGDFGDTVCRDIYVFNFINQTWSKINQRMLSTRCYFQTAQIGGKIYLLGGIDSNSTTLQSTEIFDPVSQKCSPGPELPIPLSSFAAVTINQQLYIMGGLDENSELVGTMYMFDSGLQTWSIKSPLPEPRYLMSASVINGNIFVTGGIITQSPILGQKSDQDFIEYYP